MTKKALHESNAYAAEQQEQQYKKTPIAKQVILLGLSFILITAAIAFFTVFALEKTYNTIIDSPLGLAFNESANDYQSERPNTVIEDDAPGMDVENPSDTGVVDNPSDTGVYTDNDIYSDKIPENFKDSYDANEFPMLPWGDCWATISIPDGNVKNVPVYIGDSDEILRLGVGKLFGSSFPGETGNIVLSAHVNRSFYCLQDLKNGAQIILRTVWGDYIYEVTDSCIFDYADSSLLTTTDGTEKLICYTCYPRGIAFRTKRYAIICKRIAGGVWQ